MAADGAAGRINPCYDHTVISSSNFIPDNIIGGRFKIIKLLGRGGMGEILLAEDNTSRGKVAIKSISSDFLQDRNAQVRFRREAQAVSRLNHPNICTIYEIAEENKREYIVMEYVDGVTLDQLEKIKPLTAGHIIDIALQVVAGMIAAQEQNIVHLDIKPGNIMIDKCGLVKLLDFGLAEFRPRKTADRKSRRQEPGMSANDIVMGTVSYMSPEQIEGRDLDGRSDIFSFGVVLLELLSGKNPFYDPDNVVTQYNIIHKKISETAKIPPALQKIVKKAMQKDRQRRYNDFNEIEKDLATARAAMK